ncbi:MFS transporter [Pseudonocardia broussonetiae]|uniref:MHS family MFS transporter n=1 Tax=Pseudonocardia broussonetiae TaxID=2736640 RepID=A0A6M6JC04_9PSEU|nr:MFS transporter [Pseudonocardia broussonetiae]QJY44610.1 MHS family MFS transporter [Pseudonocardia broussonetiae]
MTAPGPTTPQLRRAALSSYLGSVIEYYDFLLYATAAALVFGPVFFAGLDPLVGTIASLGTLATGYLARPLGGILFGHFGDRLGRKKMLVTTMTLMGVASILIGLLPTPAQIGALAPVLLVVLRIAQGIAVGGEWGGAVLLSAEHATSRRGLWASFTNAGAPSGGVLSTVVLAVTAAAMTEEQFLAWGWRIPFLLSAVLLALGLFVRSRVEETPVFRAVVADDAAPAPFPLVDVLRNHPRVLALSVGIGFAAFVVQATITTFSLSYAVEAGIPRSTVLNALTASSVAAVVGIVAWSALSDRLGRRPVMIGGALACAAWAFALFPLIDSGSTALLVVAVVVAQGIAHPALYGPLAALYTELFATRSRYTGASLGYQLAGTGAGFAPLVFAALYGATGSALVISVIIAALCLLTVVCLVLAPETSRRSLSEPERTAAY